MSEIIFHRVFKQVLFRKNRDRKGVVNTESRP